MINSILSTAQAGIQSGLEQAASSAQRIVRAFSPDSTEDPVAPILALDQASTQVEASAKVAKVGEELLGSILDILA